MDQEKKTAQTSVRPLEDLEHHDAALPPQWQNGVAPRFPWIGIGGLVFVLLAAGSISIILALSDGKSFEQWPAAVGPNALIGPLNSAASLALGTAVAQGVAIVWWRRAMQGSTVSQLHEYWSQSSSMAAIATAGRKFSIIALAVLMTKLAILDSFLVQRATTTHSGQTPSPINTTILARMATRVPTHYPAVIMGDSDPKLLTTDFQSVVKQWSLLGGGLIPTDAFTKNATLPQFKGCSEGRCESAVKGIGFAVTCVTENVGYDYGAILNKYKTAMMQDTPPSDLGDIPWVNLFSTEFIWDLNKINMTVKYMNSAYHEDGTCPGIITQRTCQLQLATVKYRFNQLNDAQSGISLGHTSNLSTAWDDTHKQIDGHEILDLDIEDYEKDPATAELGRSMTQALISDKTSGFQVALNGAYNSTASFMINPALGGAFTSSGSLASAYISAPNTDGAFMMTCNFSIADPTTALLRGVNNLMFLASMEIASNNITAPIQILDAVHSGTTTFYKTNYAYLAGALITMFVQVLCVAPIYYGFWQLGRKVTLGPIEIANAFRAPVLEHPVASNGDVEGLLKEVGDRPVQYGVMAEQEGTRLAIAPPDVVVKPSHSLS